MAEWQRSGPEPGKDGSDIISDRPGVRNAFRPATPFESPPAFGVARDVPAIGVIILTERIPGFAESSRRP